MAIQNNAQSTNNVIFVIVDEKKYKISVYKEQNNSAIDIEGNEEKWKKIAKQATQIALSLQAKDFQEADVVLSGIPDNLQLRNNVSSKSSSNNREVKLVSCDFQYPGEGKVREMNVETKTAGKINAIIDILKKEKTKPKQVALDDLIVDLGNGRNTVERCIAYQICKKETPLTAPSVKEIDSKIEKIRNEAISLLKTQKQKEFILLNENFFRLLVNEIITNGKESFDCYNKNKHELEKETLFTDEEVDFVTKFCKTFENNFENQIKSLMNNKKQKEKLLEFYLKSISQKTKDNGFINQVGLEFICLYSDSREKFTIIQDGEILNQFPFASEISYSGSNFIYIKEVNKKLDFSPVDKNNESSKSILNQLILRKRKSEITKLLSMSKNNTNKEIASFLSFLIYQNSKLNAFLEKIILENAIKEWEKTDKKAPKPGTTQETHPSSILDSIMHEAYNNNDHQLKNFLLGIAQELGNRIDELSATS
jgi:hypothetical protein